MVWIGHKTLHHRTLHHLLHQLRVAHQLLGGGREGGKERGEGGGRERGREERMKLHVSSHLPATNILVGLAASGSESLLPLDSQRDSRKGHSPVQQQGEGQGQEQGVWSEGPGSLQEHCCYLQCWRTH